LAQTATWRHQLSWNFLTPESQRERKIQSRLSKQRQKSSNNKTTPVRIGQSFSSVKDADAKSISLIRREAKVQKPMDYEKQIRSRLKKTTDL